MDRASLLRAHDEVAAMTDVQGSSTPSMSVMAHGNSRVAPVPYSPLTRGRHLPPRDSIAAGVTVACRSFERGGA